METYGWRAVFTLSGVIGAAAAVTCATLMPGTTTPAEAAPALRMHDLWEGTRTLLRQTGLRWLTVAYLMHSAVFYVFIFWFFRYLTDGRGFTVLASGTWASLPNIAGVVCAPLIGAAADRLGRRIGSSRARRRTAMACLLGSTLFAVTGAIVPGAILAILALSLSSACLNGAESPFFMTATTLGADNPGAAAGLLNLMGNLGGVLSIWLVPRMAEAWGWNGTLGFWAGVAFTAAVLWLRVEEADPALPAVSAASR
jgi:MFS family permease